MPNNYGQFVHSYGVSGWWDITNAANSVPLTYETLTHGYQSVTQAPPNEAPQTYLVPNSAPTLLAPELLHEQTWQTVTLDEAAWYEHEQALPLGREHTKYGTICQHCGHERIINMRTPRAPLPKGRAIRLQGVPS